MEWNDRVPCSSMSVSDAGAWCMSDDLQFAMATSDVSRCKRITLPYCLLRHLEECCSSLYHYARSFSRGARSTPDLIKVYVLEFLIASRQFWLFKNLDIIFYVMKYTSYRHVIYMFLPCLEYDDDKISPFYLLSNPKYRRKSINSCATLVDEQILLSDVYTRHMWTCWAENNLSSTRCSVEINGELEPVYKRDWLILHFTPFDESSWADIEDCTNAEFLRCWVVKAFEH